MAFSGLGRRVAAPGHRPGGDFETSACRAAENLAAAAFGIAVSAVRQANRGRAEIALARHTAMYLAHTSLGLSLSSVGRQFGRDRTTVAHAIARIEDRRDEPAFDRLIDWLAAALELWRAGFLRGGRP